jgi:hypothetical protein
MRVTLMEFRPAIMGVAALRVHPGRARVDRAGTQVDVARIEAGRDVWGEAVSAFGVAVRAAEHQGRSSMEPYQGPFHGCRSTRIFCLPTCRYDRRVLPKNHVVFASIGEARTAGYRACKVCHPDPDVRPAAVRAE